MTDALQYMYRPQLRRPVVIAAFRGWNDAGESASGAALHLKQAWGGTKFASIDPEDFLDMQVVRPHVRLEGGVTRSIEWPYTDLYACAVPGADRDAVVVLGYEPSMRWRTYCRLVVSAALDIGADTAITLGGVLTAVPHTRPAHVLGTAPSLKVVRELGLSSSRYEGPTGIVSVLTDALDGAGLRSISLWAHVPYYVPQTSSPKGVLALVRKIGDVIGISADTIDLEIQADHYERMVTHAVADDPELVAKVIELEQRADAGDLFEADPGDLPAGDILAEQFMQFLRDLDEQ